MSLKQEIETWVKANAQYDKQEFEEALKTFDAISETSKILFNCGVIHATLGQHQKAVECYQRAIKRDNYFAVAYFQQGVSNFLVGDFEEALANFNDALLYLRENKHINYEQLGLKFKLFSCEVLFNRGLCYMYLQQKEYGMIDLRCAAKEKATANHEVIDEAIQEEAEGYTVFSIGVGIIFRPNEAKVKNLKTVDYLGKARLIAAAEQGNANTASKRAALAAALEQSRDDRPPESISFGASNLVKAGLHSRSRQRSEPPINRNMFPPTPPPETESIRPAVVPASTSPTSNPPSIHSTRSQPVQPLRPEPLNLQSSSFTSLSKPLPRIGTTRTASEPRGPSRHNHSSREFSCEQPHRLFLETTSRQPNSNGVEADKDEYPDELYQLDPSLKKRSSHFSTSSSSQSHPHNLDSSSTRHPRRPTSRPRRSRSRQPRSNPHHSIEEEDETTTSNPSSPSDLETLHNASGHLPRHTSSNPRSQSQQRSQNRHRSSSRRAPSRLRQPPPLLSIRLKAHYADDTRYIMLPPTLPFSDFALRIRDKFGLKGDFKIKTRDEGDLITMGDGEDWDMAVAGVRRGMVDEARKNEELGQAGDGETGMGKMEVWVVGIV